MKQFIVPANGEALLRAAKALFGDEGVQALQKLYGAVDEAMSFTWDAATAAANAEAKSTAEDVASENEAQMAFLFNEGVSEGKLVSEEALQESFDEGYVEGVDDARSDPEEADSYIAYLIELDRANDPEDTTVRVNAQVEGFNYDEAHYDDPDAAIIRVRTEPLN